jgi:transposase
MGKNEQLGIRVAIKKLYSKGFSYRLIRDILDVSIPTISKWVNRADVESKPGRGRKSKINSRIASIIDSRALDKWTDRGASTRSIARYLNTIGVRISHMSIQRYFRKQIWGKPYKMKKKPMLSLRNKQDRLRFCNEMINKGYKLNPAGIRKSNRILFTDEKIFPLFHSPNAQTHRMRSRDPTTIPTNLSPVFNSFLYVAAGFYSAGKTKLIFYPSARLNSKSYIRDILPSYIKICEEKHLVLQQDGLPSHFSNQTRNFLRGKVELIHEFWPGNSPDLVFYSI